MAWNAPVTVVAGQVATAALWNAQVRDNMLDLDTRMNTAVQLAAQQITGLDGNGSLVLNATTTVVYLNGVGAADVNGATVPARNPWFLVVVNITSNVATLKHEDATETTPGKRFILPGDTDFPLGLGDGLLLIYVSVPIGARWVSIVAA